MKHLLLSACLMALPLNSANALSCMQSPIEGTFQNYSGADENYIMVLGALTNLRDVVLSPPNETQGVGQSESYTATFKGQMATRSGFDKPVSLTVAVTGTCVAVWCARVAVETQMLTFLEETPFGYKLSEGPCGGAIFYTPNEQLINSALQCIRGGVCTPDTR